MTALRTSLAPDSILAEVRRVTGETGPLQFLDGLERLTEALDSQAALTPQGRGVARASLVKALVNQAAVERTHAAAPELAKTAIRPVFITGLLRTGTTFLQHLLAQHPDLRSPRLWELMAPAHAADQAGEQHAIKSAEDYVEEYYRVAPAFRDIHPLDARLPEECHRLTANTFRDPIYALRYRVPKYSAWLDMQSMTPAYEYHRRQLACILGQHTGNAPVVLKCPSHLWYLDALAKVYPDAKVIRLHRAPAVAIPSVCSLTEVVRTARAEKVDLAEIGAYWLGRASAVLNGMRHGDGPLQSPPLDLRFADLVADPLGVASRVCDYIGVPLTDEARRRMAAFAKEESDSAAKNRQKHHYTAERYGLSDDLLNDHFAAYRREFRL